MPVAIQLSRFNKLRRQVELPRLLLEAVSGDILCHDVPVGWTISLWSLGCDGERGGLYVLESLDGFHEAE
jgi:hypothetical protein